MPTLNILPLLSMKFDRLKAMKYCQWRRPVTIHKKCKQLTAFVFIKNFFWTMRLKLLFTAYLAVAALCWQFKVTNSRTSTLWRLNPENGKITSEEKYTDPQPRRNIIASKVPVKTKPIVSLDPLVDIYTKDHIFYIIASTMNEGDSGWTRQYPDLFEETDFEISNNKTFNVTPKKEKAILRTTHSTENVDDRLDCGKPANYTKYDHLIGVGQRHYHRHPIVPEPEVAYLFLGTNDEYAYRNFDLAALERNLIRAKREQENITFELYIDIGNYFRIIGDTRQAIECFRHAVFLRDHPDALLNFARVLYNMEYFSDAISLSLASIKAAKTLKGYVPWQEYFTLGEIFKASGRVQESSLHLRRALELYPHHEPILKVLRDVENTVLSALHIYTLIIIIALVVAVFVVIITNVGSSDICRSGNINSTTFCLTQVTISKHTFNRAMAMRSLRGSSNARYRHRRF